MELGCHLIVSSNCVLFPVQNYSSVFSNQVIIISNMAVETLFFGENYRPKKHNCQLNEMNYFPGVKEDHHVNMMLDLGRKTFVMRSVLDKLSS